MKKSKPLLLEQCSTTIKLTNLTLIIFMLIRSTLTGVCENRYCIDDSLKIFKGFQEKTSQIIWNKTYFNFIQKTIFLEQKATNYMIYNTSSNYVRKKASNIHKCLSNMSYKVATCAQKFLFVTVFLN